LRRIKFKIKIELLYNLNTKCTTLTENQNII
jgi:hypothetical protein